MVNKKGFLRIIEVIIASLIVLSAILIILVDDRSNQGDSCSFIPGLLDEIAKNQGFRNDILEENSRSVEEFLKDRIDNPAIQYQFKICGLEELCNLVGVEDENLDICAGERVISTTSEQTNFSPKKIKLFLFRL